MDGTAGGYGVVSYYAKGNGGTGGSGNAGFDGYQGGNGGAGGDAFGAGIFSAGPNAVADIASSTISGNVARAGAGANGGSGGRGGHGGRGGDGGSGFGGGGGGNGGVGGAAGYGGDSGSGGAAQGGGIFSANGAFSAEELHHRREFCLARIRRAARSGRRPRERRTGRCRRVFSTGPFGQAPPAPAGAAGAAGIPGYAASTGIGSGAGIFIDQDSNASILNSTIARNILAVGTGGGLAVVLDANSDAVTVVSTIIALNSAPRDHDIAGVIAASRSGWASRRRHAPGRRRQRRLRWFQARFESAAESARKSWRNAFDHHSARRSPALGAGSNPAGLATDEIGNSRPPDGPYTVNDIGAVELTDSYHYYAAANKQSPLRSRCTISGNHS